MRRSGSPSGTPTGNDTGCANGGPRFTAFPSPLPASTGRVLYQNRGVCQDGEAFTLWTEASAGTIIGVTRMNVANEAAKAKEV